jgi:hypothetical protein
MRIQMKKIFVLILVFYSAAFAGGFSKVGTAAAQFLKIGVGARSAALGGTFAAINNDVDALYWNPAGIASIDEASISVSHTTWIAEISHNFAGVVIPIGSQEAIGLSAIGLTAPEQEITTVENPGGTGIYYKVGDYAFGVSYARNLTDRFAFGVTVKYIQQNLYNETASGFALDLGTSMKTGFYGMTIAMAASNFGTNLKLEGTDLISTADINKSLSGDYNPSSNLTTEEYPLPLNFRVGVALNIVGTDEGIIVTDKHRFTLAVDGNHPNDNNERANIGSEYSYDETFFLRAGYKINYDIEKWSFGAGIKTSIAGKLISVDYALADYNDFGTVSRFTVGLRF